MVASETKQTQENETENNNYNTHFFEILFPFRVVTLINTNPSEGIEINCVPSIKLISLS